MPKTIRFGLVIKPIAIDSGLEAEPKSLIKGVESGLTARLNAIGSGLKARSKSLPKSVKSSLVAISKSLQHKYKCSFRSDGSS